MDISFFARPEMIQSSPVNDQPLIGKTILITGAARRLGRIFVFACTRAGADIVLHHAHSGEQANEVQEEIESLGRKVWVLRADLEDAEATCGLIDRASKLGPLYALVNNAAIFEALSFEGTSVSDWDRHMAVNLTAPFLLSQGFARQVPQDGEGRIVNILDWRASKPVTDHFPYTVSKAGLAAMTRSLAVAFAPHITVNGLALGAILPPAGEPEKDQVLDKVPAKRWSSPKEVEEALLFLLAGPAFITGEVIHLDGGRHLL
jgi:NAD(P)-dependent dehydrogenase (short-subunit alcohol dehydrogenase family)